MRQRFKVETGRHGIRHMVGIHPIRKGIAQTAIWHGVFTGSWARAFSISQPGSRQQAQQVVASPSPPQEGHIYTGIQADIPTGTCRHRAYSRHIWHT